LLLDPEENVQQVFFDADAGSVLLVILDERVHERDGRLVVPLLKESMNEHGKTRRRVEIRKPHVGHHLASTVQQRHEDDPVKNQRIG
jgi:hypothetical protein